MNRPKVTIVVPIYRAEKYLKTCVDSLLNQIMTDIEIILVDDGSPDRSGEIADQYASEDPRIRVIHQENSGLGPARNAGVEIARGEYIGFVDSDDWVRPEMYQNLYHEAVIKNADIVVSGHCDVAGTKILVVKMHPLAGKTLKTKEEINQLRKKLYGVGLEDHTVEAFPMSACMSLYRREMILKYNLRFQNVLSEDTIYNLSAYQSAKIISFLADVNYCYRKEDHASITYSFSDKKFDSYREFLILLRQKALQESDTECIIRAKRCAIDYCRMYVGLVGNANIPIREKVKYIRTFAQDSEINKCWEDYPVELLPVQQRIFHRMIKRRCYASTLFLNRVRQTIKKGKHKFHGIT